ncbi:hypothetical protein [Streptodolium elevatio]|uniref:Uncharacterized protein n=1 Tax=Streptodolium elevatio TaxID=3157996 RepID=A0ABV3DK09_9ACTN
MPATGSGTAYCGTCGRGTRYGTNGPDAQTVQWLMGGHDCEPPGLIEGIGD